MISVMMPVYNAGKFLRAAIESILNQTEEYFEFIIVNDGSTDDSEDIILSYADPRIRYFLQKNGGEAAARNTALENMAGEFVVFQDADDISLPIRIETLKRHFTSPSIGIVHSDMGLINEHEQPMGYVASSNINRTNMLRFFLKGGTPFNNPSMMVRREVFEGLRYDTSLRIGTDSDMVFRTARNWDTVHVPQPLLLYRRHTNNLTNLGKYDINYLHIQKFLERHSLEELLPELNWQNEDTDGTQAMACALVSLFLYRRNMIPDTHKWFKKAVELAAEPDVQCFVKAIANIIDGNFEYSLTLLKSCSVCEHVVENYVGEVSALLGRKEQAYRHFRNALKINPHYFEPLENLKQLNIRLRHGVVDTPRFLK